QLDAFTNSVFGVGYLNEFTFPDQNGNPVSVPYDPRYPNDSYFLHTHARDKQYAVFGEGTYALTDSLKVTAGVRFSRTEFSFDSETGGPGCPLSPTIALPLLTIGRIVGPPPEP
ncbi:TonB-dependent receptor domain-containing protein, partial [Staphylococcus aureus]|uniref:TonB-dependent receptor domain-containing protein n=1 Tax=Staphylococcus aureus TaxID=1280 RepID=UPI0013306CE2